MSSTPLVFILDDSELVLSMLQMVCSQLGYETTTAQSFGEVEEVVTDNPPDFVLSDLNLPDAPDKDPVSALRKISTLQNIPIILVSGMDQAELDKIAAERGAQGAISKDAGLPGMMAQLEPLLKELS